MPTSRLASGPGTPLQPLQELPFWEERASMGTNQQAALFPQTSPPSPRRCHPLGCNQGQGCGHKDIVYVLSLSRKEGDPSTRARSAQTHRRGASLLQ